MEVSFRGGSQVGWVHASWPFATLRCSATKLSIASLETLDFSSQQVIEFEPVGSIPLFYSGIRIHHSRSDYPEKVIFWCVGSRDRVVVQIKETGFLPQGKPSDVRRAAGMPGRWSVVIVAILLWNLLFIADQVSAHKPNGIGPFSTLAVMLVFVTATATRLLPRMQRVVMQDGHEVSEIKSTLTLVQLVTGIMSVGFGLAQVFGG